jgi:ribonucleoside-diphosphate reductase alpha chain
MPELPEETSPELHPALLRPNARAVWRARYLGRDPETGQESETPAQLLRRVARVVAAVEKRYPQARGDAPGEGRGQDRRRVEEDFFQLMGSARFLPNSPTLMNAGRRPGLLSACFVLPLGDSIAEIFETLKETALIQKAGGGTGFDFSRLRPTGDIVSSSGGRTTGPLSFLRVFSEATRAIQQGAFRRGANMGILRISHPDIIEFLRAKDDPESLSNYNLSVAIPDSFMRQLEEEPEAAHRAINPRTGETHPLEHRDRPGEPWRVKEIFELIAERAWATGEPGVIFIDRINRDNFTPHLGEIEATNPCSEQPLLPYESCTLGSINVARFARIHPGQQPGGAPESAFDWEEFRRVIRIATRFLDNVVDASSYPVPEIAARTSGNRKIGLGPMGFADLLYTLGIPYDSEQGIDFGEKLMKFLNEAGHEASTELARERGSFPNWKGSLWDTGLHRPMRNAAVTTVAPTGTISILAGCSGGIEPLFSLAFYRHVLEGQRLLEVNEAFLAVARSRGFYSRSLVDQLTRVGSLRDVEGIPGDVRRVYVTARDIAPHWHVRMQAAFQGHCDAAISKTINFPASATADEVRQVLLLAHREGLKGVTVYRDGCRPHQPMALQERSGPYPPDICGGPGGTCDG